MDDLLMCKRPGCEFPAARDQVYCSRQCSPYGHLNSNRKLTVRIGQRAPRIKNPRGRPVKNLHLYSGVKRLREEGLKRAQIAARLGISYALVVYYERKVLSYLERGNSLEP